MKRLLAALVVLSMAGCATTPLAPEDRAAADIRNFLISIRDADRAGFDHYVDREALKTQLQGRLMAEASRGGGQSGAAMAALGALIGRPVVDFAADAFVQPEVFRAMAERRGYRPDMGMPTASLIARYVRDIGAGSVCVVFKSDGPCQLVFRDQGGTWRLVGYEGELSGLTPGSRGL